MPSDRVLKALKLSDAMFKQLFGVQKETFHLMHNILHQAFQSQHLQGGRPPKLTVDDKLLLTLQYWREYRSMDHLVYEYEVHRSLVYRVILWVEQTLKKELGGRMVCEYRLRILTPNS